MKPMSEFTGITPISATLPEAKPIQPKPIQPEEFAQRVQTLRANMAQANTDALVLVAGSNMRYYTGLPWGLTERLVGAVISRDEVMYICPRFEDSAMQPLLTLPGSFLYWEEDEDPVALVNSHLQRSGLTRVALDPKCPLWLVERFQAVLSNASLQSAVSLIGTQRAQKSPTELALIAKAMQITLDVHRATFAYLQPGMRCSEIRQFIDQAHRHAGADNGSYFCAVQFNEGTSHPHGVPGDPVLENDSLVLIDTGCQIEGYHSDITRTYAFGEVSERIHDIWHIEKAAQAAAFNAVAPGVTCEAIDHAARLVLQQHDLGPDYRLPGLPHRTGHGIGLEIHEGPYLVRGDSTPLMPGMCFSNEPMIVVPGEFGVRLEDHFYVTDTGAEWFTQPQTSITQL